MLGSGASDKKIKNPLWPIFHNAHDRRLQPYSIKCSKAKEAPSRRGLGKIACRSGMSCDGTLWYDKALSAPYLASLALKAAELQGRKAGMQFLRCMQESLFLNQQDITEEQVLFDIAEHTQLDLDEFQKDLHSQSAVKALQCDMKIAAEMEVSSVPTLTFLIISAKEKA